MGTQRPAKILIVEDDDTVRSALQEMLERDELEVEAIALASDALGSLPVINPDLVVLDLGMPPGEMQGMEMLAQLREDVAWQMLPVIIVSGWGDIVNKDVTDRLCVSATFTKPITDIDGLIQKILAILKASGAIR
jgi:DNA-binding response OmpR family regulator